MNMRSLEYVVAVKQTGSVQGAAKACYATAGTISMQITRLEDYLGIKLFACRRHPAQLTSAGNSILPKIEALVQNYRDVLDQARNASQAATAKASAREPALAAASYLRP